ncbi:NAD(P)-binding protein [Pseudoclavibacter chungangensis]|uniref:NAD(P)-binding protein n=1 Tax=Pseudoclavibacter chungangensis TaxID=587635 RepID=A0A7J5BNU8_9MICO|nr:FAD-dependent oxidoreductase [Pseudoclavibacter chungangensis]KAB1654077.1 NAD(P)-binding protein [Pseudoclavibacter chungangensis]NYJ66010.1 isorenieratene synthase [Pseudoclavibacter chungangensis]
MTTAPRDPRAVRFPATPGAANCAGTRSVVVVGGGIAGVAAAIGLAERGVRVRLVEPEAQLGGRVRAWPEDGVGGPVTMSRGFHAFFRQYYNLRALLRRIGPLEDLLRPVTDYPVVGANGDRDTFVGIPRTPPWNFMTFVAKSPTFRARDLVRVDLDTALSLLDVSFPRTYRELNGESAEAFLDRLAFPERARHLALEVFARSFFAHPTEFSAGELVAMFHSYFLGSAEGLLFDVPRDDFETTLWHPMRERLVELGAEVVHGIVTSVERRTSDDDPAEPGWTVRLADDRTVDADAVVLAAGPAASADIVAASDGLDDGWRRRVAAGRIAPAFAVLRIWTDRPVRAERPAFLGTTGYGPLDNVSVLERFEDGAAEWARRNGGSVVELHAYALDDGADPAALRERLLVELARVYPETRAMGIRHERLLIERDCPLPGLGDWDARPEVRTPEPGLKLAGDWLRSELPIALMERAATSGWQAANQLLEQWGLAGHELWSVPIASRQRWPRRVRRLLRDVRRRRRGIL